MSHLARKDLVNSLQDICHHGRHGSLVVMDLIGKYLSHNCFLPELQGWDGFPEPLQFGLMTMALVISDVGWMWYCTPRANIIELQLGYALSTLEYEMQQGWSCGHGLIAVLRIG